MYKRDFKRLYYCWGGHNENCKWSCFINGEKFEKADCYRYKGGRKVKCYKNGKRISESKYDKAVLAMQDWEMLQ